MRMILISALIYLLLSNSLAINLRAKVGARMEISQNDIFYLREQLEQMSNTEFSKDLAMTLLLHLKTFHEMDDVLKMLDDLKTKLETAIRQADREFETDSLQLQQTISDMINQQVAAQTAIATASNSLRSVVSDQQTTDSIVATDQKQLADLKRDRETIDSSFTMVIHDLRKRTRDESRVLAVIDTIIHELEKRIDDDGKKGSGDGKKGKKDKNATTTSSSTAATGAAGSPTGTGTSASNATGNASAGSNASASATGTSNPIDLGGGTSATSVANLTGLATSAGISTMTGTTTTAANGTLVEIDKLVNEIGNLPYYEALAELSRLNPILALAELTTTIDKQKARRIITKLREIRRKLEGNLASDKDLLSEKENAYTDVVARLGLLQTSLSSDLETNQQKSTGLQLEFQRLIATRDTNQQAYNQCGANKKNSEDRLSLITSIHEKFKSHKLSELEPVAQALRILRSKKSEIKRNTKPASG